MPPKPPPYSPYANLPWLFILGCAAILLWFRFWFHFVASPLPDEAYYWLWGQHPALSYFDHPPLQAWGQWLASALFGVNRFALRLPTVISAGVIVLCLIWWVRTARPDFGRKDTAGVLVLVFASPLWFGFTGMAFNDHVMLALLCVATITVFRLFKGLRERDTIDLRMLYLSAVLIGLAGLAKYNAVFFALGVFGSILWYPPHRNLLRSPHLYAAAFVCLACLSPVLIWNLQNQAASFQYNLNDRLSSAASASGYFQRVAGFALPFILALSPFLITGIVRVFRRRDDAAEDLEILRSLAVPVFVVSSAACLALSLRSFVIFYWNIVAIVALLPLLAMTVRRVWVVAGHMIFGVVAIGLVMVNHTILPLGAAFGDVDDETAIMYGWPDIATQVRQVEQDTGADFLVASDYRSGSILAHWTKDTHVDVIATRRSQFSLWLNPEKREGQNAVILTSAWFPMTPLITNSFEKLTQKRVIQVERFGYPITNYTVYLGENYRDPNR